MAIIFVLYLGFFAIYYSVFLIMLIYTAIIEEWFCRNRIPEWHQSARVHYERVRNNTYNLI